MFGDFAPLLMVSFTVAALATGAAWLKSRGGAFGGGPHLEMHLLRRPSTDESERVAWRIACMGQLCRGGGAAAAEWADSSCCRPRFCCPAGFPLPTEPREAGQYLPPSPESTEDLVQSGHGLLGTARDTISGVVEEVLEALEPGREQVGDVSGPLPSRCDFPGTACMSPADLCWAGAEIPFLHCSRYGPQVIQETESGRDLNAMASDPEGEVRCASDTILRRSSVLQISEADR